jgi:hypothetical protein
MIIECFQSLTSAQTIIFTMIVIYDFSVRGIMITILPWVFEG